MSDRQLNWIYSSSGPEWKAGCPFREDHTWTIRGDSDGKFTVLYSSGEKFDEWVSDFRSERLSDAKQLAQHYVDAVKGPFVDQPAYRPFKSADEFRSQSKIEIITGDKYCGKPIIYRVSWYNDYGVAVGQGDAFTWEQAFKTWTFDDGSPFGVKESPTEPATPDNKQPDPGDGFEFCREEDATQYWCPFDLKWKLYEPGDDIVYAGSGVLFSKPGWREQPDLNVITRRLLLVSSRHIAQATRERLNKAAKDVVDAYADATTIDVGRSTYGYFLAVDAEPPKTGLSSDLKAIFEVAEKYGCTYVKIDADGPLFDELTDYRK